MAAGRWFVNVSRCVPVLPEIADVYATRIPQPVSRLFPEFQWMGGNKGVYLTFDDGPHPEWTPRILDMLGEAGHKATFFCVGENVERFPAVFDRIRAEGHSWGNHTMRHESGWTTGQLGYLRSYLECEAMTDSGLFRPPYGRMTRSQAKAIGTRSRIVMWSLLTGDFDQRRSAADCLSATLPHMSPGAIAVLHDSDKAAGRTMGLLEGMLLHMHDRGWQGLGLDMPTGKEAGGFPQMNAPQD